MGARAIVRIVAVLCIMGAAGPAAAHPFGQKPVAFISRAGTSIDLAWVAAPDEFNVLARHLGLGPVSAEAMGDDPAFAAYFLERFTVHASDEPCAGTVRDVTRVSTGYAVSVRFECGAPVERARFTVTLLQDISKDYVTLRHIRTAGDPIRGAFTASATTLDVEFGARTSPSPSPFHDVRAGSRRDRILGMLEGRAGSISLAVAMLLALFLGIVHGLTPGHGKTIAAAYLVGSGGTTRQALTLGGVVTFTHAISTALVAAIPLALGQSQPPQALSGWLEVVAGATIVGLAAVLFARGSHDHDHGDEPSAAGPMPVRRLAAIGFVGGLVPNPEGLLIVLVAFSLHQWLAGLALIGAFSIGLGVVVLLVALAAVRGSGLIRGLAGGRLAASGPKIAAAVFLLMGFVVIARGISHLLA